MEGPLGGRPTLVLFVLPILLSAWPGGLRGGLLATALCELGSIYYLYPPTHNFFIETPVERWQALFLGLSGISISAMSEALHRARRRARRAARDARQAEAHARASEARLQTVTENARVGLVLLDPERRYTYVNAMCARMLGLASREVIGRRVADVLPDLYDEQIRPRLDRAFAGEQMIYELHRHEAGQTLHYSVRHEPTFDGDTVTGVVVVITDVTERKRAEENLRESDRRFRSMLSNVELASVMLDREARITFCNDYLLRLTGWERAEATGRDWFENFIAPQEGYGKAAFQQRLEGNEEAWHRENEIRTRSGEILLMRWHSVLLHADDGSVIGTASIGQNITRQRQDEARILRLNRVYAVLSQINMLIVRSNRIDELFRDACRIAVETGRYRIAWIGQVDAATQMVEPVASAGADPEFLAKLHGSYPLQRDVPHADTAVARAVRSGTSIVANELRSDRSVVYARDRLAIGISSKAILPLAVAGDVVGAFVLYADQPGFFDEQEMRLLGEMAGDIAFAIDHIRKEERLNYLAYYDPLTDLANQSLFVERLRQGLVPHAGEPRRTAVFVLDVERFKAINDAFGRLAGDAILREIAGRLRRFGDGEPARLARVGADRFAVAAGVLDHAADAGRRIERLLDEVFGQPFAAGDEDLRVSARLGAALFPDDAADAEALLRNAEAALKKAKAGGDRYLFFAPSMNERVAERLSMENRLREALDKKEFVLHYQPKVHLQSGLMTGAEALLRWNDPRTGLVPPMKFIPVLEETGLIHDVGRWALVRAITDYLRWLDADIKAVRIAVNVSPLQLRNAAFADEVAQALGVDPRAPAGLELELTESLIMEDVKRSIALLAAIRALGVTIAIDDFGTGYSSLSHLARLPVDTLKIDRAFVTDMTKGPEALSLVSTILTLARSLDLKVVAEGVETEEQARLLRLLRCDQMQGYLFSKPVPGEEFEAKFLRKA